MTLPYVPCGHFALGTLSKTCSKDAVFEINVEDQTYRKKYEHPKMLNLRSKTKTVSELDIVLSQLTHFDT